MVRIKTLLNLISSAVAIIALLPVLPFIHPVMLGVTVGGILVGALCDRLDRYLLNSLLATGISVAGVVFFVAQISRADVAGPVTHALILLLTIRLLTPKESRDYLQVFALGLFILAGSSLTSLDLGLGFGFLIYLVLMVFGVTLGLVLLTVFVTDKRLALTRSHLNKLVRVSVVMLAASLILMLVFFFVLPRARRPMWTFLNPGGTANVGLSESVQPGAYSRIASVKNLAFRAEVDELPGESLYWRALVLNQPEGDRWVRVPPPHEDSRLADSTRALKLTIYPEVRSDRYLITLEQAALLSGIRYERSDDHVYTARNNLNHPYRIEQLIHLGADIRATGRVDRDFYLVPPQPVSARMQQAASGILNDTTNEPERLAALADFFRNQQLSYAQEDLPDGPDPLDQFLFEKKRGYCEFFASAYIALARLAGIPARLVGGYYGGEYNPVGGYYLVSEDTAHVWVEVLTADNRWQRVDPSQWAVNATSAFESRSADRLSVLQQVVDSLNYRWVQTVVLFDFYSQINLFRETRDRFRAVRFGTIEVRHALWLAGLVACAVAGVLVMRVRRLSPEARLLKAFRVRVVKRYGRDMFPPTCGLTELGEQLDDERCREFATIYQGAIFRDRALTTSERVRLKQLLKKI